VARWALLVAVSITLVAATAAQAGILDVAWDAPTTNADGSLLMDLAGYRVYFGTSSPTCPGPTFNSVSAASPTPAPGSTVTYRLTGLTAGTTYFVRVTAVDTSGNQSACSAQVSAPARSDFIVTPTGTTKFGSVLVGSTADSMFTVQNGGASTLSVGASTSVPFSVVSPALPFSLASGAKQVFTVRFSPTAAGGFGTTVTFTSSGGNTPRDLSGTSTGVDRTLDVRPPVTAATLSPTPGASGWNTTDVTVTFATEEAGGSGVAEISVEATGAESFSRTVAASSATVTITTEGTTTLSYFARDRAGNQEPAQALTIRIDKTRPILTGLPGSGCVLWPPNHHLVTVARVTARDLVSGLARGSPHVTATSNEVGQGAPDVVVNGTTVRLRAERSGRGSGRVYTITVNASDLAGNTAMATATCTVPHHRLHKGRPPKIKLSKDGPATTTALTRPAPAPSLGAGGSASGGPSRGRSFGKPRR
jgi:hypothetical protein